MDFSDALTAQGEEMEVISRKARREGVQATRRWDSQRAEREEKERQARMLNSPTGADRSRRSRENRIKAGGEQIGLTLRPEAANALHELLHAGKYANKTQAIEMSLINEAKRLRRRLKRQGPENG